MKPLFITAHCDDLEVCAGGTAARYGGRSVVLYPKKDKGTISEAEKAAEILGIEIEAIGPMGTRGPRPDVTWLDEVAEGCDTIIASSPWDTHPEHQAAARIARQVARKNNINLWFMDHAIPGGYNNGPRPNHFVNIEHVFDDKYDAIEQYKVLTEQDEKAIMYRDRYYGLIHGMAAAEGFTTEHTIT